MYSFIPSSPQSVKPLAQEYLIIAQYTPYSGSDGYGLIDMSMMYVLQIMLLKIKFLYRQ